MFILGNLIIALGEILDMALTIYMWVIVIAALISWVNPDPYNPIVRILYGITEPVLRPVRRLIGFRLPVDISPLIVILGIYFVKKFLIVSLIELGYRIKIK